MTEPERIYDAIDIADMLKADPKDVKRWLCAGRFPGAFRVPNRQADITPLTGWRIPHSSYMSFVDWAREETRLNAS